MWSQSWENIFKEVEPFQGKVPVDVTEALVDQVIILLHTSRVVSLRGLLLYYSSEIINKINLINNKVENSNTEINEQIICFTRYNRYNNQSRGYAGIGNMQLFSFCKFP